MKFSCSVDKLSSPTHLEAISSRIFTVWSNFKNVFFKVWAFKHTHTLTLESVTKQKVSQEVEPNLIVWNNLLQDSQPSCVSKCKSKTRNKQVSNHERNISIRIQRKKDKQMTNFFVLSSGVTWENLEITSSMLLKTKQNKKTQRKSTNLNNQTTKTRQHYLRLPQHSEALPPGENIRRIRSMSQRIDSSLAFFKIPFFLLANVAWRPFVFSNFFIFNFTLPILLNP